eukprot:gnl/TRDRNA2_/TRDRNA2_168988_c0_seq1.p1 gnl/TRDRNA2_/TRDRNA2_168988_c0~~gnl/TRDRNA2_/TRDRNA2_168988_c0_seq1.p1  ORF type:complete len:319 (-),score=58.99 gnl/TRDRNA2_/TRDRNA2_168988_c0_seq1:139-1059(-)
MPAETYQYDIVYQIFCNDKEFWSHWRVVDCARNSPLESISQENASIRVVMDLPTSQRLYPTAYTPGFSTVPIDSNAAQGSGGAAQPKKIDGLPPGYSVALDVHILENARVLLEHQRRFRGAVDPKLEWLDAIVAKVPVPPKPEGIKPRPKAKTKQAEVSPWWPFTGGSSASEVENQSSSAAEQDNQLMQSGLLGDKKHRPEAGLRAPVGSLPVDCSTDGFSEDLKPFSDLYGDRRKVMKHVGLGAKQVYAENTLVSVFGDSTGLPSRDGGHWDTRSRGTPDSKKKQEAAAMDALDRKLERMLDRGA